MDNQTNSAPPLPPLDASALSLIDKAYAAPGAAALVKTTRAELIKALEKLPLDQRAHHLASLAMANPFTLGGR